MKKIKKYLIMLKNVISIFFGYTTIDYYENYLIKNK